jgi:regulator of sirC expression with transglutaminase-like and TPR domain
VLFACERAVELTPHHDVRDSRGLVRALLGDREGAIEDFEFFVKGTWDKSARAQREAWIEALRAGTNPFTSEVLAELRE